MYSCTTARLAEPWCNFLHNLNGRMDSDSICPLRFICHDLERTFRVVTYLKVYCWRETFGNEPSRQHYTICHGPERTFQVVTYTPQWADGIQIHPPIEVICTVAPRLGLPSRGATSHSHVWLGSEASEPSHTCKWEVAPRLGSPSRGATSI